MCSHMRTPADEYFTPRVYCKEIIVRVGILPVPFHREKHREGVSKTLLIRTHLLFRWRVQLFGAADMGFSRATMNREGISVDGSSSDDFLTRLQQAEARDSQQYMTPEQYNEWAAQQQLANMQQHAYYSHHLAPSSKSPSHQHVAGYRRDHRPDWAYVDQTEAQIAYQRYAPPGAVRGPTGALSDEHNLHKGSATNTLPRQQRSMFKPLASQIDMSQPTAGMCGYHYRSNHWPSQ